mmetsp:Transcript_13363/g.31326  ORF Transcript_13363/g.31326 Transcript_13363/m.31326 type:complete len:278 (-) Transcript_13363:238-1071(-)|eukprot:CAMPEP_0178384544 /NCGR_PEP_ID=MMETSP0689_2-20121128/7568_1 /TAXON_ID=160604 /ORGANISM="Amphidinium massartii, Strain CS-259" /LENGTH=277 /DNA_ID=CAMNT_0020004791 /DNA_START=97 /DNA_END=930 /DNA_ORIENTATION=+
MAAVLRLSVTALSGSSYPVELSHDASLKDLQDAVVEQTGTPTHLQKLAYGTEVLTHKRRDTPLSDFVLPSDAIISLVVASRSWVWSDALGNAARPCYESLPRLHRLLAWVDSEDCLGGTLASQPEHHGVIIVTGSIFPSTPEEMLFFLAGDESTHEPIMASTWMHDEPEEDWESPWSTFDYLEQINLDEFWPRLSRRHYGRRCGGVPDVHTVKKALVCADLTASPEEVNRIAEGCSFYSTSLEDALRFQKYLLIGANPEKRTIAFAYRSAFSIWSAM